MKVDIDIKFTEAALKELKRAKEDDDVLLRLAATSGGCSGYMYDMHFVKKESIEEDIDIIESCDGFDLVIDKKSLLLLDGTTIDWVEELNQRGFKFINPLAERSCGCGQSFS